MAPRLQLHDLLTQITDHVYFQPPSNIQMSYPCITYARDADLVDVSTKYADNVLYRHTKRYQVTVIDRNPDSDLPDQVEALPMCLLNRAYPADDLNHWVFTLFF